MQLPGLLHDTSLRMEVVTGADADAGAAICAKRVPAEATVSAVKANLRCARWRTFRVMAALLM
jgi:hypothetical protein